MNPYFKAGTFTPHTIAKASAIQAEFTKAEAAFDLLHNDLNNWGSASSSSFLEIGTGSKNLVITTGRFIQVGQTIALTATSDTSKYMVGRVTAYDGDTGAATVNVTDTNGTGTFAAWTIAVTVAAALPGDVVTAAATQTLTGKTMNFGSNTFSMTLTELNAAVSDGSVVSSTELAAATGIVTAGLVDINSTVSLTSAIHGRKTLLIQNAGITITFPDGTEFSEGEGLTLTNLSGADVTLAFPGGSDAASTTLKAGTSAFYFSDGDGYWYEVSRISQSFIHQSVRVNASGSIYSDSVGFRGLPANARSAAYTLTLSDIGKLITNTTGGWAIPSNATVAFPVGSAITLFNASPNDQTVTITADTLRLGGNSATGTRTIPGYGVAALLKVNSVTWVISGHVS